MNVAAETVRLKRWLVETALPLWWERGVDRSGWGYQESLHLDASPSTENRRCRVQARQVYSFLLGATLGGPGDQQQAIEIGFSALRLHYRRPDGLYRTMVSPAGDIIDDTPKLYDHAFILLALASARAFWPGSEEEAKELLAGIRQRWGHSGGGYAETGGRYAANPLMHLFEASLLWLSVSSDRLWADLADELGQLALHRLIGPEGFVREYYDESWAPTQGENGRSVEPGHQFEWAWLMQRWAACSNSASARNAALALHKSGCRGLSSDGKVALDEIRDDYKPLRKTARLWPQSEWLKSAAIHARAARGDDQRGHFLREVQFACDALTSYLYSDKPGLWRDTRKEDGTFVDTLVPASTLYHIVTAIDELERLRADQELKP